MHATEKQLEKAKNFLAKIRKISGLKEKKKGVFYMKNSAFLHFHFFGRELFLDIKRGKIWKRIKAPKTKTGRVKLIKIIEKAARKSV